MLGLDEGADDYVAKPFGMMELMARVRTALRHAGQNQPKEKTYSWAASLWTPSRHVVRDGDREVTLTLKEFQVLCLLLERAGTVFTRDQLLNTIWGYEFDGASRTVDVHIRTLRQKLGKSGDCIRDGAGHRLQDQCRLTGGGIEVEKYDRQIISKFHGSSCLCDGAVHCPVFGDAVPVLQQPADDRAGDETWLVAQGVELNGMDYLTGLNTENRVTWVDTDGTVLYDSQADETAMENHGDREEIQQAMTGQSGYRPALLLHPGPADPVCRPTAQ